MSHHRTIPLHRRKLQRSRSRGIAVVLVLGLLAITLAISYATLRGQGTTSQLAQNNSRALDARVAAQSGLAAAIRKISENSWRGVDVPLSANITNQSWYQVSFTTGDAKLLSTDPLYAEYAYRLTIDSMGYAADPQNPAVRAEHHSRCIVQLVRKKLLDEPPTWATLTGSTVYQFDDSKDAQIQFPVRINGSATLLGKVALCLDYPGNSATTARDQYLGDLFARIAAGKGDDRPLPQLLTIKGIATTQEAATMALITGKLMITPQEALAVGVMPAHPGTVLSYKLYPGGKSYTPPVLQNQYGSTIQSATIGPDPVNNPLGLFRSSGSLTLQNDVQITGTVIAESSSDLLLSGPNVALKPYNLPSLYGSSLTYQLPTAMVAENLRVNSGSDAQITGSALVWNQFELKSGVATSKFALTGNLITQSLYLRGRTTWTQTAATWNNDRILFSIQPPVPLPIPFFPDYQQSKKGFVVKPLLTFSPDSSGVKPHWQDWTQPVFQPDPADPGLKWEVVRWEENL